MNFIEHVMRVMTHIVIGAALGLAAWVPWSGWLVVTGRIAPAHRLAEVKTLMGVAPAGLAAPMQLVPVHAAGESLPACHGPQPPTRPSATALSGADL